MAYADNAFVISRFYAFVLRRYWSLFARVGEDMRLRGESLYEIRPLFQRYDGKDNICEGDKKKERGVGG